MNTQRSNMLPPKIYELFRWLIWIVLPAIGVLLTTLTNACGWNIPIDAILATLSGIELFLGTILGISKLTNDMK